MSPEAALEKVFELAGSQAAVARELGISPQAVGQWRIVPAQHARRLSAIVHGRVTAHELRPDVFGPLVGAENAA